MPVASCTQMQGVTETVLRAGSVGVDESLDTGDDCHEVNLKQRSQMIGRPSQRDVTVVDICGWVCSILVVRELDCDDVVCSGVEVWNEGACAVQLVDHHRWERR